MSIFFWLSIFFWPYEVIIQRKHIYILILYTFIYFITKQFYLDIIILAALTINYFMWKDLLISVFRYYQNGFYCFQILTDKMFWGVIIVQPTLIYFFNPKSKYTLVTFFLALFHQKSGPNSRLFFSKIPYGIGRFLYNFCTQKISHFFFLKKH